MPIRINANGSRDRHYIKEWREFRNLTQDQLADAMSDMSKGNVSKASISRIESYKQPYTQDFLELCRRVLNCTLTDLLTRDPRDEDNILALYERARPGQRKRMIKEAKKVLEDQAD
jgi:transcriptional regulator with XRE-family HTH domain